VEVLSICHSSFIPVAKLVANYPSYATSFATRKFNDLGWFLGVAPLRTFATQTGHQDMLHKIHKGRTA
jgi:hypothetical protein